MKEKLSTMDYYKVSTIINIIIISNEIKKLDYVNIQNDRFN